MGFGFDAIDKQYRSKKIVLECVDCSATKDVKTHVFDGQDVALCPACFDIRETDQIYYLI